MPRISTMAGLSKAALLLLLVSVSSAAAPPKLQFHKDSSGQIQPFKIKFAPLLDFVRAYADVAGVTILYAEMEKELIGEVTLLVPKAIPLDALTELFFEALDRNGFTVVDAPKHMGWLIQRERDARDAPLPLYDIADMPPTHRMVTAFLTLRNGHAEDVARAMRSFMPANSRIIPATQDSRLMVTDIGANIHKLAAMIDLLDIPYKESRKSYRLANNGKCPGDERTVEKLVIENVELSENAAHQLGISVSGPPGSARPSVSSGGNRPMNGGGIR